MATQTTDPRIPIAFDAAGESIDFTDQGKRMAGIVVVANADVWSCILNNANGGSIVFRADSSITNHRSIFFCPSAPVPISGIYAQTMTNIVQVIVYLV